MWHAQQWKMHNNQEGNNSLRIMKYSGEVGFLKKGGKIKGG